MTRKSQPMHLKSLDVATLDECKSEIISSTLCLPFLTSWITSWKAALKNMETQLLIKQHGLDMQKSEVSVLLPLSSPHGTSSLSGFHCLNEVVSLSVFIY